jgi:translocation and assembly module TamB
MTRRRLYLSILPALVILLAAGGFYTLLHTEPGARWIWQRVAGLVPGQLQAAAVSGDLRSGLRLQQVSYGDESLSLQVDRVMLRLDFDLLPLSVAVHDLEFGVLEIHSEDAGEGEVVAPEEALAALELPIPVEFVGVRGERIAWRAADDSGIDVGPFAFSASWHERLEVTDIDLSLATPEMSWRGGVELALQEPFTVALEARGDVAPAAGIGLQEPLELEVRIGGDLGALRLDARSNQPQVTLGGTLSDLFTTPTWDLQVSAGRLPWPLDAAEPLLVIDRLEASSYGRIDDYGLELDARLGAIALAGVGEAHGRLLGKGDGQGLRIDLLEVSSEALVLDGAGRVEWSDGLAAEGTLDIERLDPTPWFEGWGRAAPFEGRVEAAWRDNRVEFTASDIGAPGTVANLAASGAFDAGSDTIEAEVEWQDAAWPPGADAPDVESRVGRAHLAGRLEAWSLDADLELAAADLPTGRLRLQGTGDRDGAALEIPRGEVLGGTLAGTLEARWAPVLSWSARARITDLSTAPLAPAWPGRISGEVALRGRLEPQELDVEIRKLVGILRDRPLNASGDVRVRDSRITARDLGLRYGTSEVWLDGDLRAQEGLALRAQIESLADFVDGAAGSLAGEGMISLDPATPSVRLNLQGRGLSWGDYSADTLGVVTDPGADADLRVVVEGIGAGETRIDTLTLSTGSERPLDRVDAELIVADTRLALGLSGSVVDWAAPLADGWTGSLSRLRLEGETKGWIELLEPAALSVKGDAVSFEQACFQGHRNGRLCVGGHWRGAAERRLEATLENVSPDLALSLADSDLTFTQLLSGTLAWEQSGAAKPEATVDLRISAGEVQIDGEDEPVFSTGQGKFGFEMAGGRLFAGNLDIPLPGAGGIDTDFSAPDLSDGLASPVGGRLQLSLRDIEPVLHLLPGIEGSSGPVTADMRFSGTLADPRLAGQASLVRGRISHFASGLLLDNLQLSGEVNEFDQTELIGTFRAGEGQGTIRVVVNLDDILEPAVLFELDGENLTLVNVPDLNLKADPDLRLVWRESTLNVAGRVRVPEARLSPRYLPTAAAVESPDAVIVAGEDPHARPDQADAREWAIRGELELELGADVRVELERAQARLSGTAVFGWDGQPMPVATGGFGLTGELLAYGQLLRVTEGRVNFGNRPADNPFLNIRAEREIFGNSQVRRAGVLVTGTLRRPVLETYTEPMTTRERALALLVTGSDFDYEQGVGAVEVGMYVAPRLFISYGVGLFDDQNVISARFDLGKGFGVKATSGQREAGVDISYTIDR